MSAKKPRAAYCTGCGETFPKMHLLINHRRMKHCGGRFLAAPERDFIDKMRSTREEDARHERIQLKRAQEALRTGRYT